jgi:2-oxoglutarate ferredoxin oxidoreductase subunit alpha
MREVVTLPDTVPVYEHKKPAKSPEEYLHYDDDTNYDAPIAHFGEGYRIHLSGLTHRKDGFPVATNDSKTIAWKMARLKNKIEENRKWLFDFEQLDSDAETVIISYGSSARTALEAKNEYERQNNKKVGFIRLIMLWPFPYQQMTDILKNAKKVVVVEMNQGQVIGEIARSVGRDVEVIGVNRVDGELITPEEVLVAL